MTIDLGTTRPSGDTNPANNVGLPAPGPGADETTQEPADGQGRCIRNFGVTGLCIEIPEEVDEQPEVPAPLAPPAYVTVSDIASFVPAPPSVTTEPDGIGARGLPLNAIAAAQPQTVHGELFGFPVSVAFAPAGFRQDWGDGTVTETAQGGASWSTLQQAEFTPTDTSHAYATKGSYSLTVTALYTAVVDFGPWGTRAVDGVVQAPAAARDLQIVEVHTALVQRDCLQDPAGVGCPG